MNKFLLGFAFAGLIFLLNGASLSAQTLPRRAWLGVAARPLDEAAAKANNLKMGEGLIVASVLPNSTFEAMGVKSGDVILAVNGRRINSMPELVEAARALSDGDAFEVELLAGGARVVKKGTAKGRPKESSENAEVLYDAVEMSLGTLRTIAYVPKKRSGKMPAVFYLQGFPCESQDLGTSPADPRKRLFEDWARAGFVVFRVERPNIGDSRTTKDCRDIDFDEEIAVSNAGYRKLASYDFVDAANVFLFGHSMGAVTAPFVAQTNQPRGVVAYGSVVRSWFEYFIDISRIQSTYAGTPLTEGEAAARANIAFFYEWLEAGKSPAELRKNPQFEALMDAPESRWRFSGDYFNTRHGNFWHTMNKKSGGAAWSKVKAKVLSMHGEFDVQAINSRDAELIAAFVNQSNPGNAEFLLVPQTEHVFVKVDSYRKASEILNSGNYLEYGAQNYNGEIGRLTSEWMTKTMKSGGAK